MLGLSVSFKPIISLELIEINASTPELVTMENFLKLCAMTLSRQKKDY